MFKMIGCPKIEVILLTTPVRQIVLTLSRLVQPGEWDYYQPRVAANFLLQEYKSPWFTLHPSLKGGGIRYLNAYFVWKCFTQIYWI